jgi:GNAT superfamily N-acetyltransferase
MQAIHVRAGSPNDAQAVSGLLRRSIIELCQADHEGLPERIAAWLENKTPENITLWINSPRLNVIVAEDDGQIVAVGAASKDGEVFLNYVHPARRFLGVSRAILSNLETWLSEQGQRVVNLTSTKTALPFYLAAGYGESAPVDIWMGMPGYPLSKYLTYPGNKPNSAF